MSSPEDPRLLVCLDGLSWAGYFQQSQLEPNLSKLLSGRKSVTVRGSHFQSPQAIWAELLTGESWTKNGVYGYGVVTDSLSNVQIASEKNLLVQTNLDSLSPEAATLIANVPLLLPSGKRIWLSDGSMPLAMRYFPPNLEISAYRPRPFFSSVNILSAADLECFLEHELARVAISLDILRKHSCRLAILRITTFDCMFHAFGNEFCSPSFRYCSSWRRFLTKLSALLSSLEQLVGSSNTFIFSTYAHVPCERVLDLNQLLARNGFLNREGNRAVKGSRTQALHAVNPEAFRNAGANLYAVDAGQACSPVEGTIMLNSKSRFLNGVVDDSAKAHILSEIEKMLAAEELPTVIHRSENTAPSYRGPELVVSGRGLAFSAREQGDFREDWTPRTVHYGEGFLLASHERLEQLPPYLRLKSLHRLLFTR
ncbi:MAG: alkaline phosphatase family protein [Candidatus Obscuribacterales bacterium]|nr:alkaline phosphatase family protein [Candidatus Obscuribacterales bacterium]